MNVKRTCIAAAIAAAFICLPAAAKEYRSADVHPEDYPTVMAVKFMSDYIKQKTGGGKKGKAPGRPKRPGGKSTQQHAMRRIHQGEVTS